MSEAYRNFRVRVSFKAQHRGVSAGIHSILNDFLERYIGSPLDQSAIKQFIEDTEHNKNAQKSFGMQGTTAETSTYLKATGPWLRYITKPQSSLTINLPW